jgi:energy-coupling factor transport system ATP-binding protein
MSIKFKNITYFYNYKTPYQKKALSDVSLEIDSGITAIIGETGSGKSTLIKHINALLLPTSGTIHVDDFIVDKKLTSSKKIKILRYNIGMVFQFPEYQLFEETVEKDICFGIKNFSFLYNVKVWEKIKEMKVNFLFKLIAFCLFFPFYFFLRNLDKKDENESKNDFFSQLKEVIFWKRKQKEILKNKQKYLLKKYCKIVGIKENYFQKSPFSLSGGEKRRVAIAGILVIESKYLVFDEPTAGLDPKGEIEMMNLFIKLNHINKKKIIIITHNMNHVLQVADQVIVLHKNTFLKKAEPLQIFSDEKLIKTIGLELPTVIKFLNKLKDKGIDVSKWKVKNVNDLIFHLVSYLKKKKK